MPVGVGDFLGGYDWRARPWAQEALGGAEPEVVSGPADQLRGGRRPAPGPDLRHQRRASSRPTTTSSRGSRRPSPSPATTSTSACRGTSRRCWSAARSGARSAAAQVVEQVKAKFAKVREEHPEFAGKSAILAYGGPDGYGAYATGDTRSRFFTDLGFELPEKVDELAGESFFTEFSQEQFRLLDQDLVAMYGSERGRARQPGRQAPRRGEEGRMVFIGLTDQFAGALGFASALSLDWLLENEVDGIAAAVDGDPATAVEQPGERSSAPRGGVAVLAGLAERLVVRLLRRVVVVPLRCGAAVAGRDQAVEVVLPAGADVAGVGVVRRWWVNTRVVTRRPR